MTFWSTTAGRLSDSVRENAVEASKVLTGITACACSFGQSCSIPTNADDTPSINTVSDADLGGMAVVPSARTRPAGLQSAAAALPCAKTRPPVSLSL